MKKKYAVSGRTIGTHFFETKKEARDFVFSLPDSVIEYDAEVALCKWVATSGSYEEIERY